MNYRPGKWQGFLSFILPGITLYSPLTTTLFYMSFFT